MFSELRSRVAACSRGSVLALQRALEARAFRAACLRSAGSRGIVIVGAAFPAPGAACVRGSTLAERRARVAGSPGAFGVACPSGSARARDNALLDHCAFGGACLRSRVLSWQRNHGAVCLQGNVLSEQRGRLAALRLSRVIA